VSGALITFEGVEGSGKTTQMMRLERWLRRQGRKVEHTREPDGTRLGVAVRALFKRPGVQPRPLVARAFSSRIKSRSTPRPYPWYATVASA